MLNKNTLFFLIMLVLVNLSCKKDDDSVHYLSPEEQKAVDKQGIEYILKNYYLNPQGDITPCNDKCSADGDKIALESFAKPLPSGGYFAIIPGKQGTGKSPDSNDDILLNFGINFFNAREVNQDKNTDDKKLSVGLLAKTGNIYLGTEPVETPDFYYYDIEKYKKQYIDQLRTNGRNQNITYNDLNLNERNRIKKTYEENKLHERNVVSEFVEGIKQFKSRKATANSKLSVQGVIIAPSANSKGLDAYLSLAGVDKDNILVFVVDLLSVTQNEQ